MFSEYASKFLSQSKAHAESGKLGSDAPLFHSIPDNSQKPSGTSLYASRNDWRFNWTSRYASKYASYRSDDDEDALDDTNHDEPVPLDSSTSTIGLQDPGPPDSLEVEEVPEDNSAAEMGMKPFVPVDFLPQDGDPIGQASTNDNESIIPHLASESTVRYDTIWSTAYLACMSFVFATSLMVWLITSGTNKGPALGDTIYTIIQASWKTLFIDMVVAILISVCWLFIMSKYAEVLVYTSVVAVPIGFVALIIYPLVNANKVDGGKTTQDTVMRWTSLVPLVLAVLWSTLAYRGRRTLSRSLGIIKLACSILASQSPALLVLAAGTVFLFILVTAVWVNLFMRLFLEGRFSSSGTWVLDPKAWIFGGFYVLSYIWTWGVASGIQRATIAASVSQWYFYRHTLPHASSSAITRAGLHYALTAQFGTICFSSAISILLRLPLLILPSRLIAVVQAFVYTFLVDASALLLTSPLALVNSVINSQGLVDSARTMAHLRYLDQGYNNPEVTHRSPTWPAYRLAKMLLSAARILTGLGMGFGAWIHAAKYTNGGSLYGYMVGLIAGFVGWFILGATEGTLSMIVDSAFVCFALDNAGKGGHCQEADRQFGSFEW